MGGNNCIWYIKKVGERVETDWCYLRWFSEYFFSNPYFIDNLDGLDMFFEDELLDLDNAPDVGIMVYGHTPSEQYYIFNYNNLNSVKEALAKDPENYELVGFIKNESLLNVKESLTDNLRKMLDNRDESIKQAKVNFDLNTKKFFI